MAFVMMLTNPRENFLKIKSLSYGDVTVITQANSASMALNEKVKPLRGSSVAEILNFKIFHFLKSSNEDSTYKVNLFLTIAVIYKSAMI